MRISDTPMMIKKSQTSERAKQVSRERIKKALKKTNTTEGKTPKRTIIFGKEDSGWKIEISTVCDGCAYEMGELSRALLKKGKITLRIVYDKKTKETHAQEIYPGDE